MRPLVRLVPWIAIPGVVWLVVVAVGSDGAPPPPPASGPVRAETLDRRAEVVVPPAPSRAAWRVHPSVLSATEAAGLGDGWVVLDSRSSRLHFLDAGLDVVRSVGGEGEGPGELLRPFELAVLGDSLVAVLDGPGTRLDLFSDTGTFLGRLAPRVPGCPVGLSRDLVPDPSGAFVLQGVCAAAGPRWVAARVALDGNASVLASASLEGEGGVLPPFGRAVIAWRGRLWAGSPDGCFSPLDAGASSETPAPPACLPSGTPIPVPDSVRSALSGSGRSNGVVLPESWPPFLTTRWSVRGPVLGMADADGKDTRALLRDDGVLVLLRAEDPVTPGENGLLLTRDFLDGTGFRVVPWPAAGAGSLP